MGRIEELAFVMRGGWLWIGLMPSDPMESSRMTIYGNDTWKEAR
jgi:hypothetical protein